MLSDKHKAILKSVFSRRMLVALIMGFACGLPLLLTKGVLQAWMKKEGIDLSLIGLTNLLAIPYSIKFIWAPFFDRFTLSFLGIYDFSQSKYFTGFSDKEHGLFSKSGHSENFYRPLFKVKARFSRIFLIEDKIVLS